MEWFGLMVNLAALACCAAAVGCLLLAMMGGRDE